MPETNENAIQPKIPSKQSFTYLYYPVEGKVSEGGTKATVTYQYGSIRFDISHTNHTSKNHADFFAQFIHPEGIRITVEAFEPDVEVVPSSSQSINERPVKKNMYRQVYKVVSAEKWYKVEYDKDAGNGNLPEDQPIYHLGVGYYRRPEGDGQDVCPECGDIMHNHGWLDNVNGGYVVCPGNWIINEGGTIYPCEPALFELMYEKM